jgi:hypothetical protein
VSEFCFRRSCFSKVFVDAYDRLQALGLEVVLIGLGSERGARNFKEHFGFKGISCVDPEQASYKAMQWSQQPEGSFSKGLEASNEAGKVTKLKLCYLKFVYCVHVLRCSET